MRKIKKLSFIVSFLLLSLPIWSQIDSLNQVRVIARAYPDSIVIRWAPTNPVTWQYGNEYGYQVSKYLLLQNGKLLPDPQVIKTWDQVFKPISEEKWDFLIFPQGEEGPVNDYAAIAAQAIYGETFETTDMSTNDTNPVHIYNQVRAQEMRFAYMLMACDYDPIVANAVGLRLVDKEVNPDEKYVYQITPLIPTEILPVDTGFVYVGIDDAYELPPPQELTAEFGDQTVMLRWNVLYHQNTYISYQIERSDDGGQSYQPTSDLPVARPQTEGNPYYQRYMYSIDSLAENEKEYFFQIRGLTSFGEIGPPSEPVSGKGYKQLVELPLLEVPEVSHQTGIVKLNWSFPEENLKDLEGFIVEKSPKADGIYDSVHEGLLPPQAESTYQDQHQAGVAYYRIRARDIFGQESKCLPHMVQIPDSIPPQAPLELKGEIDSVGVVTISWQAPPDADVTGYRVYRSNFEKAEYFQVTVGIVSETNFRDSVSMNTLTEEVFYKVSAEDVYFNQSELSEPFKLTRPDIIPPAPPLFQSVKSTIEGVELTWIPSSSRGVAQHILFRNNASSPEWELIETFLPQEDSLVWQSLYIDKTLEMGQDHQYILIAVDSANLESIPSPPVAGRKLDSKIKEAIKKLKVQKITNENVIQLTWQYDVPNVETYAIYRGINDNPLTLYKQVEGNVLEFEDKEVKRESFYRYRLQAFFYDGSQSAFSEEINVLY